MEWAIDWEIEWANDWANDWDLEWANDWANDWGINPPESTAPAFLRFVAGPSLPSRPPACAYKTDAERYRAGARPPAPPPHTPHHALDSKRER